jgi:hypothetical protein
MGTFLAEFVDPDGPSLEVPQNLEAGFHLVSSIMFIHYYYNSCFFIFVSSTQFTPYLPSYPIISQISVNDVSDDFVARIHHFLAEKSRSPCRAASSREWPKGLSFHNLGDSAVLVMRCKLVSC